MENYPEILRSRLNDPAYGYRRDAFLAFLKSPVRNYKESPTVKDYVEITDAELELMIYGKPGQGTASFEPSADANISLFNDRIVKTALPDSRMIARDLVSALTEEAELVSEYVYTSLGRDRNEFLINSAWRNGLFLYIPSNTRVSLKIEHISDASESYAKKTVIICGSDCMVNITDVHTTAGDGKAVQGHNIYFHAGENSRVQYNYLQDKSTGVTDITYIREFLSRYAEFTLYHINHGSGKLIFSDESVQHGDSSAFRVYGVNFSSGDQRMDIRDSSFQQGKASSADIQVRGVVTGRSSTIHRGNIDLEEEAITATGFYDSRILLLSKDGYANSKPGLMIKNANTRSKHGSSISNVDEEQVFYLRSRGIDEERARGMITAGFVGSIIERAGNPEFTKKIYQYAEGLGADAFLGKD